MNENGEYEFSILNCREMFTDLSLVGQEGYKKTVIRMQTQVFENHLNCTMITKINESSVFHLSGINSYLKCTVINKRAIK